MKRKDLLVEIVEDMALMRRKMLHSRSACDHSVTHAQMGILMILQHEGGLGLKEVASRMCASSSAATQMVNGLVKAGYVTRKEDGSDRRKIGLTLTADGRKKRDQAKQAHVAAFTKALEPLSDTELAQWHTFQRKMIANL